MAQSKDLFDDSTMTFGEHLEILRTHLIRAIIGLLIFVVFALMNGQTIVSVVRSPIDSALRAHGDQVNFTDDLDAEEGPEAFSTDWWKQVFDLDNLPDALGQEEHQGPPQLNTGSTQARTIQI
ncbi:MAG: hypothetical protein VB858_14260, partial [Planctomycetaceae bacterium]